MRVEQPFYELYPIRRRRGCPPSGALLDRDLHTGPGDPGGNYLDGRRTWGRIRRQTEIDLVCVDGARVTDRGQHFGWLSIYAHCNWRIDRSKWAGWEWTSRIDARFGRPEAGGNQRQDLARLGWFGRANQREVGGVNHRGSVGGGDNLRLLLREQMHYPSNLAAASIQAAICGVFRDGCLTQGNNLRVRVLPALSLKT